MPPERLRSIVPMFGGATSYVDTLDAIIEYVATQEPTTDEFVGWHRGTFDDVSSRDSIRRRVDYLEDVGFLELADGRWVPGPEGRTYLADQSTDTLVEIMCRRNMGLRSLLYALLAGPMTIEEVSQQQLDAHPDLGWDPSNTDMASQRVNWLRSLGLVRKDGAEYELTDEGRQFVESAVSEWADAATPDASSDALEARAGTYETVVSARSLDPEFRATVLSRYEAICPVSGVDHPGLLDVAHVLSWSEYPDHRADLSNVLALSKTHHAAFDRELFTIDADYRLRVNPSFETENDLLQRSLVNQAGERVPLSDGDVDPAYLRRHNEALGWVAD